MGYFQELKKFLAQANTNDLKTKHYISEYLGTKVKVSFGQGGSARIPWISFLREPNTTSKGIYPVYLYYKDFNILILAYGVSETNLPLTNWPNTDSKQTILEYFKDHYSKKPKRYGSSYVYKVYDVNALSSEKEIENDLDNIINEYNAQFLEKVIVSKTTIASKSIKATPQMDFSITQFKRDLDKSGLIYPSQISTRIAASLLTKPFVILTGLSGSGKTKLAQAFVQWICQDANQYRIVPVGADWTNREPLLGYPNALNSEEYVKPDSGVLDLIIQAESNPKLPYFLILDEMNLSHVERYFADFLSVMESKGRISLHASNETKNGVPSSLSIPLNLFIIGTVNIDETTHMFSPKVLDRANTIEFRISEKEMETFLGNFKPLDIKGLNGGGAGMAKSFLKLAATNSFATKSTETIHTALLRFFGELKKIGAEFGYRSATEILQLIYQLGTLDASMTTHQKLDIAIIQKLLPKLHGSRRKLCPILEVLAGFCMEGDVQVQKEVFEKDDFDFDDSKVLYPLSLEKIVRMYKSAIDNGFASFAEA